MHLHQLSLQHIRTHQSQTFQFSPTTTLIVGPNASGKTTIIEAIALLSTGESFRATRIEELISLGQELGRVNGLIKSPDGEEIKLEILVTRGLVQGKKTSFRLFSVNGVRRQKKAATGKFLTVVFRPEDMRLIEGSPARRRQFLDRPLVALSSTYERSLQVYEQTLKRRNKLLLQVREREQPASVLQYWTLSLLKHGQVLQEKRQVLIRELAETPFPLDFRIEYKPSIMSEARLEQYAEKELVVGKTMIGPHKDDFEVYLQGTGVAGAMAATDEAEFANGLPVSIYGSRGQQRLAVLWLKLGELAYVAAQSQTRPVLLLDDILSELDETSRGIVSGLFGQYQAIVTTTDETAAEQLQEQQRGVSLIVLGEAPMPGAALIPEEASVAGRERGALQPEPDE